MTMTAAVFARQGILEIQERPIPERLGADEVLLEVEAAGVCGTDLHILSDPPGHPATPGVILGHEIVARVAQLGDGVRQAKFGQRVTVDANLKCGLCRPCRRGKWNHCENWTTIGIFQDGGFTRFVKVPEKALQPISDALPLKDAIWTELLSCVIGSTDQVAIQPGQVAVVIGAGPAGMLHGLMFKAAGAKVLVADVSPFRLALAQKEGLASINVRESSLLDAVMSATEDWGADVVVDAVGNQFQTALEIVGTGGTVSLFGMNSHAKPELSQNLITRKELSVFGSYVGYNTFPRAIQVLESRAIQPSSLITHEVSVAHLPEAVAAARRGEAMKVMVQP
ncbi:MAG: alcohol dehydrogenase catalytic domain-containing protein [Trueperaceae bacterium]|nr:alcohol dehydrogenase catalytic domain-containing protein [Trueperaceae bacterium]